jgi:hypothetical protein
MQLIFIMGIEDVTGIALRAVHQIQEKFHFSYQDIT